MFVADALTGGFGFPQQGWRRRQAAKAVGLQGCLPPNPPRNVIPKEVTV